MNKENAIKVLVQVARIAQKTGVLSLEDASATLMAIKALEVEAEQETPSTTTDGEPEQNPDQSQASESVS